MPTSSSVRAPAEARPIDLEKLAAFERDVLRDINERVDAARLEEHPPRHEDSWWSNIDPARTGRVIVIDGDRGTGKTSLLLTILNQWLAGWRGGQADHSGSSENKAVRDLENSLRNTGKHVRPLRTLDFDPLPDGLPVHAWLLQPWKKVIDQLAVYGTAGSAAETQTDLAERWSTLFHRAAAGWVGSAPPNPNMLERVLDTGEQALAWFVLQQQWQAFVDDVFTRVAGLGTPSGKLLGAPDPHCVIVVPIDDVDLECERLPEVLHALRLFRHHRVVYLLTAHVDHALEVLKLDYIGRHMKLVRNAPRADSYEAVGATSSAIVSRSEVLATAQLNKTFPSVNRIPVTGLSLSETLEFYWEAHGSLMAVLNGFTPPIDALGPLSFSAASALGDDEQQAVLERGAAGASPDLRSSPSPLGDALSEISRVRDLQEITTFRTLQQGLEIPAENPLHSAVGALTGLSVAGQTGEKFRIDEAAELVLLPKIGWSSPVSFGSVQTAGDLVARVGRPQGPFRSAANLYLAIMLKELRVVDAPNVNLDRNFRGFVWTYWDLPLLGRRRRFAFRWPWVKVPTLLQIHCTTNWWRDFVVPKATSERDSHMALLEWWITLQLSWLEGKACPSERLTLAETFPAAVKKLQCDLKADKEKLEELNLWIGELRYMALPEFLLESPEELWDACIECGATENLERADRQRTAAGAFVDAPPAHTDADDLVAEEQPTTELANFEELAEKFLNNIDRIWKDARALKHLEPLEAKAEGTGAIAPKGDS
jgi:hypothetical protein